MKNNNKIALIGFNGFVGEIIYKYLRIHNLNVIGINRDNYNKYINNKFDLIINSAMPSKRFWAKKNPDLDYRETVIKTKEILENWNFNKIIHISSISARCQKNTVYGVNKKLSEDLCLNYKNHLIVRLGPMYGPTLKKGVLIDLKNNQSVYYAGKSKYSFTNIDFIGNWIASNLHLKGLIEIGSQNYIALKKIKEIINSKSEFEGPIDDQLIISKLNFYQDSYDVIKFINSLTFIY